MRVEYNGAVAFPDTVEEAAALMRLLTGSPNGRRQAPVQVEQRQNGNEPPNIPVVIRGLRDPQRAVFAAIVGNNGSIRGNALVEALHATRQGLGGLLVGLRKSLEAAGVHPEQVLRTRETDNGREYYIPTRVYADVQEGLIG